MAVPEHKASIDERPTLNRFSGTQGGTKDINSEGHWHMWRIALISYPPAHISRGTIKILWRPEVEYSNLLSSSRSHEIIKRGVSDNQELFMPPR